MHVATHLDENLLEIRQYHAERYRPLVDYGAWRVAMLNYIDELLPENLTQMQRHEETDEVFVLLQGRCILFIGEGQDSLTGICAVIMEPLKLYNIKKSVWHTHTLSLDARVLIIENRETTTENSPLIQMTNHQQNHIIERTHSLWRSDK